MDNQIETNKILLTGDIIVDEILIPDKSTNHKDVLTVNNDDINRIIRYSGIYFIYRAIKKISEKHKTQSEINYVNLYSNCIPKFITVDKWKKKEHKGKNDQKGYFRDEFLGSIHDFWNKEDKEGMEISEFIKKSENLLDLSIKYKVFSIFDRFTPVIIKGAEVNQEYYSSKIERKDITPYLQTSRYIILRTKYFKDNVEEKDNGDKDEKERLYESSPFNIITTMECEKCGKFYEKTILITSLREIRDLGVYIPMGSSWENILGNIHLLLTKNNNKYSKLQKIKYIIIAIDDDGILIAEKVDDKRKYKLICNSGRIDGYRKNHPEYEQVSGYLSFIQAYLTYEIACNEINWESNNIIINGITKELSEYLSDLCLYCHEAMIYLDKIGFKGYDKNNEQIKKTEKPEKIKKVEMPIEDILDYMETCPNKSQEYSPEKDATNIQIYDIGINENEDVESLNFLNKAIEYKYESEMRKSCNGNKCKKGIALSWAKEIVKKGYHNFFNDLCKESCKPFIPYAEFSDIFTIDKSEIVELRNIERSIRDYQKDTDQQKPLSIAVFGEPGSGKSYSIKEIVKGIFGSNRPRIHTFNISQMKKSEELIDALRLVQNEVLKGDLPVVFWDEFDSEYEGEELGWLKFFLSPMQDGTFLYNQVEYTIGRCIFIFAGGTCSTNEVFVNKCKETGMKKVKAPDFLGRLKGTLNVPSMNPPKDSLVNEVEHIMYEDSISILKNIIRKELYKKTDTILPRKTEDIILKYAQYVSLLNKKSPDEIKYKKLFNEKLYKRIKDDIKDNIEKTLTNEDSGKNAYIQPSNDKYAYIFRRALVLRKNLIKMLNRKEGEIIDIDDNVLNAFLEIDQYYYDARSLISILNSYHIDYKQFRILPHGIPSLQQLDLHTDGNKFIKYCIGEKGKNNSETSSGG